MSSNDDYVCTLSSDLLEKAKRELNENPATRQQKLADLRSMFTERPDIKFRLDDSFLIRFLRVRKFDVRRAFKTLVHYYEVRSQYKDIFSDFTPSTVLEILEDQVHLLLPSRDKDGRRIFIVKPGRWDPSRYTITACFKATLLLIEMLTEDEETQVNGVVLIADYSGMTMNHVKHMNPVITRKMADTIQNAMPLRLKAFHYVNQPKIFDVIFGLFRPFLSEKMIKRLHFHGNEFDTLHQYIPSSILPTEYGGVLQNATNREWIDQLVAKEVEFAENNKYGFPKSKEALGGGKSGEDPAGGLVGTFKSLNVD
ncbi:alpha-tocopherol transfer protein-like [Saccoglossus kowalevskii]|uniref:Alpha-tocopherol transfer protein-like n=1 Tax=Saccoglossus kowalevskii TaxID=10224 RepID=A0ABM0GRK3_SACKO|nr:PREDICTED: alpha-tocopherol transfer protein-like [Saccoglossus kowalevskii]